MKEQIFYVKGMHCASCELNVERKLLEREGVKAVNASTQEGKVSFEFEDGKDPNAQELNGMFKKEGYTFSSKPLESVNGEKTSWELVAIFSVVIIVAFILLGKSGLSSLLNINSHSSLFVIFLFGAIAGVSSCAALVGGLVLSMSKQWGEVYALKDSTTKKLEPHLIFNLGRFISYGFFGAVLGGIGKEIKVSQDFAPILIIVVSFVMIALGLQMLGVKAFRKLQITMPKVITRSIADERNFKGKYMPFVLGALTFFLPCGFTLAVQAMALISGSIWQGGFMMMAFALGTMPALLLIGLSAVKLGSNPKMENTFGKIAAILVIFFALYNFNAQLNVLGYTSLSDIKFGLSGGANSTVCKTTACDIDKAFGGPGKKVPSEQVNTVAGELPPIVDGKQIVKMDASASGYTPRNLKAKVGIPLRWEITDKGTSGCTNAIIAKDFFSGQISLTPGETSVKEFTPTKVGTYKFSCWMGMVSGTFEIVQ